MVIPKRFLLPGALILAVLAGAGTMFWYLFFRETLEMRIRRQLDTGIRLVERGEKGKGMLAAVSDAKQLERLFAPKVEFLIDGRKGTVFQARSARELSSMLFLSRKYLKRFSLKYTDLSVSAPRERGGCAEIRFTGTVSGTTSGGETFREVRRIRARMLENEHGELVFESFSTEEVIKL